MQQTTFLIIFPALLASLSSSAAAGIRVPNHSFEEGGETPSSWSLSRGEGQLIRPAVHGQRAVAVTGDGSSDNGWLSESLPLAPNEVYRLRFHARRITGTGGLPVSGPLFCNRDLGALGTEWTQITSFFVTPRRPSAEISRLRFGQWQIAGQVAFDEVLLDPVIPVYRTQGNLTLGDGEIIEGGRYTFNAPYQQSSANHARPLAWHQCSFNSNRWQMSEGSTVVYRHRLGIAQQDASVEASIGWYRHGELVVSASADGEHWQEIGTIGKSGAASLDVPDSFLPTEEVWVRLTARAKTGEGKNPALQLNAYRYEALLDDATIALVGSTRYLAVTRKTPQLDVAITDLGDMTPGGESPIWVI
jgi:hypothetical protein